MAEASRSPVAADTDPVLVQFREQITDNDRAIVEAINKRLKLVAQIKRYKEARKMPFLDTAREECSVSTSAAFGGCRRHSIRWMTFPVDDLGGHK